MKGMSGMGEDKAFVIRAKSLSKPIRMSSGMGSLFDPLKKKKKKKKKKSLFPSGRLGGGGGMAGMSM